MKANFIIIKMLVYIELIAITVIGYTTGNIKGFGEKEEGGIQMICSSKERETCEVEKLTCKGCYYDKPSKEEIKAFLLENKTDKYALLNEIFAIRDTRKETQNYTIYVDGCISVYELNKNIEMCNEIEELRKQRDCYKERYLEFNNAFVQGGRKLTED